MSNYFALDDAVEPESPADVAETTTYTRNRKVVVIWYRRADGSRYRRAATVTAAN